MPRFFMLRLLPLIVLVGSCSEPEVYKPLIEISNATLSRPAEDVLRITLDYELAPAERLPLPYKEIVVSPLEPQVKIFAALEESSCRSNTFHHQASAISPPIG